MALTHNSNVADSEPTWSEVDKNNLPNSAFADREARRYPHHWVQNGGDPDDDGRYTTGMMYLHEGGLNAAWSAAQGGRSGEAASNEIKSHLQTHRKALGKEDTTPAQVATGHVLLQPLNRETLSGRREYDCVFMQAGRVKQADQNPAPWLLPPAVIQKSAHLFNSAATYVDHPDLFGFGWRDDPKVRHLAGVTFNARWSDELQAAVGGIRLYDEQPASPGAFIGALLDQVLSDQARGLEVPKIGLSAAFFQTCHLDDTEGIRITDEIHYVESVDFVYDAGAGGYVRAALSASGWGQEPRRVYPVGGTMPHEAPLPQPAPAAELIAPPAPVTPPAPDPTADAQIQLLQAISARLETLSTQIQAPRAIPTPEPPPAPADLVTPALKARMDTMEEATRQLAALLVQQGEGATIQGAGQPPVLTATRTGTDDITLAFEALLEGRRPPNGIRPLSGIREMYHLLSGDFEMTGIYQPDRVYLANVTSSTMATICANVLNKAVVREFQVYPHWWEPAVTIVSLSNFQAVRWVTLGGVGELPTVAEGAAYTELTWDDAYETATPVKKGGYLGLTMEAIDKDDTGRIAAAPRALAQAAWLTLGKAISDIVFTTASSGHTCVDTGRLFNSTAVSSTGGHANLGSTAFSLTSWRATQILMMKQTELNSGERLAALVRPRLIWVPIDLEAIALRTLATEEDPGSGDYNVNVDAEGETRTARLAEARRRVITSPFTTDATDWAAQADPQLYPSIGVGFRYGEVPEIFSVADPLGGLMFTNDTLPIKVRYVIAVGPTDWRGLYKHEVSG
ncbi:MAG TPA: hypothetical protein VMX14_13460 [Anaerolineae bacterium]|nr:hypothetical protein [Anaerolineae bacterium]